MTESSSPAMFTEDDFFQISALQHYVYCPRQCALIHVEDVWKENVFTVRGDILHEKVDTDTYESRGTIKTVRGLKIHSFRFGISGRCDVVEFHGKGKGRLLQGQAQVEGDLYPGTFTIIPVEFKSGEPKDDVSDKVQLCAQALCLEEMLNTSVRLGTFFYAKIRRRVQVEIDGELRRQTEEIIANVRELITSKRTPSAEYSAKCWNCSLEPVCMPKAMNDRKLKMYLKNLYLT
ncbi:MAG: CRISPR-associated protein Cas4 [Bacteroidetes bacterium]|nr:CRISPR-associated protein Cas4 [Bacteroidota bacterium]MCL5737208.1 CRISPR-associated protein Cas4 [Bacteroidota bacterium]